MNLGELQSKRRPRPWELSQGRWFSSWRVPSKNHHPDLTSTEPQFFAALFFTGSGPIQAKHAGIKKAIQRINAHES